MDRSASDFKGVTMFTCFQAADSIELGVAFRVDEVRLRLNFVHLATRSTNSNRPTVGFGERFH